MLRNIVSTVISLSIALTPVAASSQDYIFRYKFPIDGSHVVPEVPEQPEAPEYEPGNDIQAWFVAPVGYDFYKRIPVATTNVGDWRKDTGGTPQGIEVRADTGEIVGVAEAEETTETLYHGFDSAGRRIARAEMHFSTFKPVGQVSEVNWYTHTGEYFYSQIPAPENISVVRWEALNDNPSGMSTRSGAFEGRPEAAGTYAVAWRGFDYLDREVAFTYGSFLVENGPIVGHISDQVADKSFGESFFVDPVVKNSIGTITYALKPVAARPAGLTFKSDDGTIRGVFDDFDTSATFVIEARDSGDGSTGVSNEFTLTTLPEVLDLSSIPDLHGTVGMRYERSIAGGSDNLDFALTAGQLPAGISLTTELAGTRSRGVLSGTPTAIETQEGLQITASGEGAETVTSNPFKFRIFSDVMGVTSEPVHARINTPFATKTPTVVSGADAPYVYSSSTRETPGITFDEVTGTFASAGIAEAGDYDKSVRVRNASGRQDIADQIIRVYNNLTLAYEPLTVVTRLSNLRVRPILTEDSVRGSAKFTIIEGADRVPAWMSFNERSGTFSGTPGNVSDIGTYGPFVVTLVDGFNEAPVRSGQFSIRVDDRPDLVLQQRTSEIQRWVSNETRLLTVTNAYQGVTYSLADRGNLPSTLRLNADGFILGRTTDPVGTEYTGIKVRAVDGIGYSAELDVTLKVIEPKGIGSIDGNFDKTLVWTVNRDFIDLKLPRVYNTFGKVSYVLGDNPFGLQFDEATLALTGRIPVVGTHTLTYSISDETERAPITGTVTFDIRPDMEVSLADVDSSRGQQTIVNPSRTNGIAPFKWEIVSGKLPSGGTFDPMALNASTGSITGKPREEGSFPITLRVTDKTLQERTVSFVLNVAAPLPFSFTYGEGWMNYRSLGSIKPTVQNQSEEIAWSIVSGTLPEGVRLVDDGIYDGYLYGTPREDGSFPGIVIRGFDTGTGLESTETVDVKVRRTGDLGLRDAKLRHRAGEPAKTFALGADNVTAPSVYELVGNPYPGSLTVDAATGTVSVAFAEAGTYPASLKVTDLFERTQTVGLEVEVVGPLAVGVPDYAQKQYLAVSHAATASNAIGKVVYLISPELPAGLSFDPATGSISGAALDVSETVMTITATDELGGANGTASKSFTLKIDEREKPVIVTASAQSAIFNQPYMLNLSMSNVYGEPSFALVSGALPDGLALDPVAGTISGTPSKVGQFDGALVRVTDTFNGVATSGDKLFSFSVKDVSDPAAQISVLAPAELAFRVGSYGSATPPTAQNSVGDLTWSISDLSGTGLGIDQGTGVVSGTPASAGTQSVTFSVTDFAGRSAEGRSALVVKEALDISFAASSQLTYNYRFDGTTSNSQGTKLPEIAQPVAMHAYGQQTWTIGGARLPAGLTFNTSTGAFEGSPQELGDFGPFTLTLRDSLPGVGVIDGVRFTVVMNNDPIDLAVDEYVTKVGYAITTTVPRYDNVLGDPRFFPENNDLDGTNLKLDEQSGVITGSFTTPQDRNINVAVSDDLTRRVTSRPVALKVLPLLQLTAPQVVRLEAQAEINPVSVTAVNVAGELEWNDLDVAQKELLPEGITFDVASGSFVGETDEIGTFGPFIVTAVDRFHGFADAGSSNGITLQVSPGAAYLNLREGALADTVKRAEGYSHDFMTTNLDVVGIDEGFVKWSMAADTDGKLPSGMSIGATTGILSGKPTEAGKFLFKVTAAGGGKSSTRSYSLTVGLPEIDLQLADATLPEAKRKSPGTDNTYSFDFKSLVSASNIPLNEVVLSVEAFGEGESLPSGIAMSGGVLTGLAEAEAGTYPFRVTARFTSAPDEDISVTTAYQLELADDIGMAFIDAGMAEGKKRLAYSFDLKSLIDPASVKGIDVDQIVWSWTNDPARDTATTMTTLPKGLALSGSVVSGTPENSGLYSILLTATASGRAFTKVVGLDIGLQEIALLLSETGPKSGEKDVAYSEDMKSLLTATNIPKDGVRWAWTSAPAQAGETAGLPTGLTLNTTTGMITGSPLAVGKFRVTATATFNDFSTQAEAAQDSKTYVVVINGRTYKFKHISTGASHSCGVTTEGGAKCWGNGFNGQVGNNTTNNMVLNPVDVSNLKSGVASISAGNTYSCAVTTAGAVKCWGNAASGKLGNGSTSGVISGPVDVTGLTSGVVQVSAGESHTCAVTTSGGVKCWGLGASGRLGNNLTTQQNAPVDVVGLTSGVKSVSVGQTHTCAVTTSGAAKCWGGGTSGQLGNNVLSNSNVPVDVEGLSSGVTSISAGNNFTCATVSGGVKCWGIGTAGQIGNGASGNVSVAADVVGIAGLASGVSTGSNTACAITTSGTVSCWGGGKSSAEPIIGINGAGVLLGQMSSGGSHTCVLNEGSSANCWGTNGNGQLGVGHTKVVTEPVEVSY